MGNCLLTGSLWLQQGYGVYEVSLSKRGDVWVLLAVRETHAEAAAVVDALNADNLNMAVYKIAPRLSHTEG